MFAVLYPSEIVGGPMASSKAKGGGGGISPGLYFVITLIYLGSYLWLFIGT